MSMETPPLHPKDSAEQRYLFGSEDIKMQMFQFCSHPEVYMYSVLTEGDSEAFISTGYDVAGNQEIDRGDVARLFKNINALFDMLYATCSIDETGTVILPPFITDPDIIDIVSSGRDSESALMGMLRLCKRAGVPPAPLMKYFAETPFEGTSEEQLFARGIAVRIAQVFELHKDA